MRSVLGRLRELSPRNRLLVAGLLAAILPAVALALALQRDTRVELFAVPLRSEQIAEVAARFAEWNVSFAATSDNVRVDPRRRNELLMRLAEAGVPHAHLGGTRELLEKVSPLTPQTVLDQQQRDGLADDLAAGLRGLPGVADARVVIAPAKEGTFVDEPSAAASASVRITLAPGAVLKAQVAEGIRSFVAAGVAGLDPKRVALLDDRGVAFGSEPAGDEEAAALQASLQSALDAAFGAGATIVRVRVAYDPRARQLRERIDKPLGSRALRSASSDERYSGAQKRYSKASLNEERGSDVQDVRTDIPAGRLERISVAVAVDAARALDLDKIRSLAGATLGLVPSRGDALSVEAVVFARPAPAPAPLFALAAETLRALGPAAFLAAAAFGAFRYGAAPFAGVCRDMVRRVGVRRTTRAVAGLAPAHVRGALRDEPPHTAAAIISALPAATATAVLELYPPDERAQIVRRMARTTAPVAPDYESVLRRG
ncbi:MAG TPA: flagellar M-ring protein FliF C-terminal domain-containing protein [Candidatus Baltobacteraceae bacterium]|nr:flagellar M-ring protein FliF C-terminal domain-containing protein [Candidatus Baltobacteraceae bacterium]